MYGGSRCPCGNPDVVETSPRLPDGTPFPTVFYLTCPRATSSIGTLEAGGMMREMTDRLGADPDLAAGYRVAHQRYLEVRDAVEAVPEIADVLVVQSLAEGPGVNPLGDEALAALPDWWRSGPCVQVRE